jgi:hypothetical protein
VLEDIKKKLLIRDTLVVELMIDWLARRGLP